MDCFDGGAKNGYRLTSSDAYTSASSRQIATIGVLLVSLQLRLRTVSGVCQDEKQLQAREFATVQKAPCLLFARLKASPASLGTLNLVCSNCGVD